MIEFVDYKIPDEHKIMLVPLPDNSKNWDSETKLEWMAFVAAEVTGGCLPENMGLKNKKMINFIRSAVYLCIQGGFIVAPCNSNGEYRYDNLKDWKEFPDSCKLAELLPSTVKMIEEKFDSIMENGKFVQSPYYSITETKTCAGILMQANLLWHQTGNHLPEYDPNNLSSVFQYFDEDVIKNEDYRKVLLSVLRYPHPSAILMPLILAHDLELHSKYNDFEFHQFPDNQFYVGIDRNGPKLQSVYLDLLGKLDKNGPYYGDKDNVDIFRKAILRMDAEDLLYRKSTVGANWERFSMCSFVARGIVVKYLHCAFPPKVLAHFKNWIRMSGQVMKYPWDHGAGTEIISARGKKTPDFTSCKLCFPYADLFTETLNRLNQGKQRDKSQRFPSKELRIFYNVIMDSLNIFNTSPVIANMQEGLMRKETDEIEAIFNEVFPMKSELESLRKCLSVQCKLSADVIENIPSTSKDIPDWTEDNKPQGNNTDLRGCNSKKGNKRISLSKNNNNVL